jgi:hypothetical protein
MIAGNVDLNSNLDVNSGTIKLDENYPNGVNNVALNKKTPDTASGINGHSVAIGTNTLTSMTSGV